MQTYVNKSSINIGNQLDCVWIVVCYQHFQLFEGKNKLKFKFVIEFSTGKTLTHDNNFNDVARDCKRFQSKYVTNCSSFRFVRCWRVINLKSVRMKRGHTEFLQLHWLRAPAHVLVVIDLDAYGPSWCINDNNVVFRQDFYPNIDDFERYMQIST